MHSRRNGMLALTRYTTTWQLLNGRWRVVAAQFTPCEWTNHDKGSDKPPAISDEFEGVSES